MTDVDREEVGEKVGFRDLLHLKTWVYIVSDHNYCRKRHSISQISIQVLVIVKEDLANYIRNIRYI